jgi:ribonuclease HI
MKRLPGRRCKFEWCSQDPHKEIKGSGGLTRADLQKMGIPWPPPRGWKKRLPASAAEPVDAGYDYYVNFDGGCWPNPGGEAKWGYIVKDRDSKIVRSASGSVPPGCTSNNVAEYVAITKALEAMQELAVSGDKVLIRGDSRLVINRIGDHRQSSGFCRSHCVAAQQAYRDAKHKRIIMDVKWVPRLRNAEADALTRNKRPNPPKPNNARQPDQVSGTDAIGLPCSDTNPGAASTVKLDH